MAQDSAPLTPNRSRPPGRLRQWWDRLLSGSMPSDPLYLSHRTWKKKIWIWIAIGAPPAIAAGIAVYALLSPPPATEKPPSEPTAAEVAARTPIVPQDFRVAQNTELQVTEVGVDRTSLPHHVTGLLRNTTNMRFSGAEVTVDLTNMQGSQVGAAVARVDDIPPHSTVRFATEIPQKNVTYVLVREVKSRY